MSRPLWPSLRLSRVPSVCPLGGLLPAGSPHCLISACLAPSYLSALNINTSSSERHSTPPSPYRAPHLILHPSPHPSRVLILPWHLLVLVTLTLPLARLHPWSASMQPYLLLTPQCQSSARYTKGVPSMLLGLPVIFRKQTTGRGHLWALTRGVGSLKPGENAAPPMGSPHLTPAVGVVHTLGPSNSQSVAE